MFNVLLYSLHIVGMASIIAASGILGFTALPEIRKKILGKVMLGGIHMQFLVGMILFFINLGTVNHAKIGVKIILAVILVIYGTIHQSKIRRGIANPVKTARVIFLIATLVTLIAFVW
jgi:hypothetical protein